MQQFADEDCTEVQRVSTTELQAPVRLLTAEEISAVAGGPALINM